MNVEGWLKDLGLEQYAEAFAENDVDGHTLKGHSAHVLAPLITLARSITKITFWIVAN